ncbi:Alpha-L-fucosidase [Novipirellula aureliae]|uniref:Alpha-L-fucosidase n=1 Tax=Novipirellula aureliae TaxID=2527966 RepID=A0A5C6DEE7_9BACT|nr:alpha-L-fucosidase [Novipirellula aureliae]TWU34101.1 Alpha-L-fucosidase [Novipirellula aureliae]
MHLRIIGFVAGLFFAVSCSFADESIKIPADYAPSESPSGQQTYANLPINPAGINVVSGNLGNDGSHFRNEFRNHMNLWMTAKGPGPHSIEWKLQVPEDGDYEVSALVSGKGARLAWTCNGEKQDSAALNAIMSQGWDRVNLGTLRLKAGENSLRLMVENANGFKFDALELVQPVVKADLLKEALAMRQKPDWFKNAGYGLMFQWTNRATPPKGSIKPWEEKVNDFDLEGFVDMVEETGAAYVLWSITWGQQYISAPIQSLDAIIAGRTTKRDLLGEMADALQARGIKLIFYYHYGYDCNHSIDADWMKASGGYEADKTELYQNWMSIVSEIGDRYGEKLHGWWFDGGQRYYNCHFDNTPGDQGILSAPFKELTQAAKKGNPERVVAYNSWVKPRLTEYQDYYAGEGAHVSGSLDEGTFPSGPQQGLLAHGCFIFEKRWGHIEPDTIITKPKFTLPKLTAMIKNAQKEQFPLSINLEMYEDGSVSPDSVALLKQLKDAVRRP